MGIVAVDPLSKTEFIPESEKESETPTKFFYTPMKESEKVEMAMRFNGGTGVLQEKFLTTLVNNHLAGWENFNDSKGEPVKFSKENFDRVPWVILLEIGSHILESSGFLEVERKN